VGFSVGDGAVSPLVARRGAFALLALVDGVVVRRGEP